MRKVNVLLRTFVVLVAATFIVVACQRKQQEQVAPENATPEQEQVVPEETQPAPETTMPSEEEAVPAPAPEESSADVFSEVKDFTFDMKDKFIAFVNETTTKFDGEIGKLQEKLSTADDEMKAEINASMDYLKEKRAQLDKSVEELKNATAENWQQAKDNVTTILGDIKNVLEGGKK